MLARIRFCHNILLNITIVAPQSNIGARQPVDWGCEMAKLPQVAKQEIK
ncbi:hypothetical protein LT85_5009 [Collimonas arenae]|uniref:Uncharacterized protein n=1 Tax=Collimonas arenae TaxID=279058 RepID=A0A0A1FMI7_9BURK|nr:hypothetical protein LT85_5009 [Collimonas arenae]